MKKLIFLSIISLFIERIYSQNTVITIDAADQQLCNIYLYDNGGAGSDYGANRNDEITIRSNNPSYPSVRFSFPFFDVHPSDTLYIYDGMSSASPLIAKYNNSNITSPFAVQASINNASGALTFRFKTDGTNQTRGFWGSEVCIPQCQSVISSLSLSECIPAPVTENNSKYFNICLGDAVTFAAYSGPGSFPENDHSYHQDATTSTYTWDFGDGTTEIGRVVTHQYSHIRGYEVKLTITDVHGCSNTNTIGSKVRIAGNPFVSVNTPPSVCTGTEASANYGTIDSSTIVIHSPQQNSYARFDSIMFIPDGPNCPQQCYNTYVTFNSFTPGQAIQSARDILSVCIGMEHSYTGDLGFRIICPNGNSVVLDPNTHSGGSFMGIPYGDTLHSNYDNGCDPTNNPPGNPYVYCWSQYYNPPTTRTLDWLSFNGGRIIPPTDTINNTNYIYPNNSLNSLIGCPMNGTWNIEICDDYAIDNGYIFWWNLNLDPRFLPAPWNYTVGIDTVIWTGSFITGQHDSVVTMRPTNNGTFPYTLTLINDYGCSYDTTFNLTVVNQPFINLGADILICNGSSASLDAGIADHYLWNTGDTTQRLYNITSSGFYSVTVTNTDRDSLTCSDSSNVHVNLTNANAPPLPSVSGAFRCNPGSVTLTASGGTNYIWYSSLSGGYITTGSFFNTPVLNTTTTYYVSNIDSCESMRVPVIAQINNINIDAGPDQAISCGDNIILNSNTVYDGTNSLTYSWTPVLGLNSGSVEDPSSSPNQTTNYTVMVTDGLCTSYDEVRVSVFPINININFNATPQTFSSPPFNVQFENQTQNINNYNFTWCFGDGASLQSNNLSISHQYNQNGLYDVSLEATSIISGCSNIFTIPDLISCSGGITCAHSAIIIETNPVSTCLNTPAFLSCIPVTGASYQWNFNGTLIPNSNNNSFLADQSGNYSVTIIQNGCAVTSNNNTVIINDPPLTPIIITTGNIVHCGGGSMTLNAPSGIYSYLWSNNETTHSISITDPGIYTVQITDNNGCTAQSQPFLAGASPLGNPDICIVSIDSVTNKNIIVWSKPVTNIIDHFNIYGEGMLTNIFSLVGSIPYNALSIFTDSNSFPDQQAYRYKITAVDTCNSETNLSAYHQTIHLIISQDLGNSFNLTWNYYEGVTFPSYKIYRGTSPSNMTLLATIASSVNSYTDPNPPTGYVYYQIEAVNPNSCTPSKGVYKSTRSNIASNNTNSIGYFPMDEKYLKLYPNPASEFIFIEIPLININNTLTADIYSTEGQILLKQILNNALTSINIKKLAKGLYIIKVENSEAYVVKKFIKE